MVPAALILISPSCSSQLWFFKGFHQMFLFSNPLATFSDINTFILNLSAQHVSGTG